MVALNSFPRCGLDPGCPPNLSRAMAARKKSRPPWWLSFGGIGGLVGIVCVVSFLALLVAPAVSPDADLSAVRGMLKENLPTGKWEEIRWWPARVCPGKNDDLFLCWLGQRICRLKYRTDWGHGMEVADQVFVVDSHGVRTVHPTSNNGLVASCWRECFPDDPQ